jgi:predicted O-methyltransferase YrrM
MTYVFEPKWQHEHARLRSLEATFHDNTTTVLAARGVTDGWSCLEVGAGAGGVARWMAACVGRTGRVVATDRDTRFLAGLDDVREHDIAEDPVLDEGFDLAHARAVLEHIPARQEALARMVAAVRPGGWVVIEDVTFEGPAADLIAACTAPDEVATSYRSMLSAVAAVFRAVGADPTYAVGLPTRLTEAGLEEVGAQIFAPVLTRGDDWVRMTLDHLRTPIAAMGLATDDEVEYAYKAMDSDNFHVPPLMVSAWGRRPR